MHPCFVYAAHEPFSPAELSAARLDGHLVELGDAYIPADAVETAALRAASMRSLLTDRMAATHLSAAWVHGALDAPPVHPTVQRAVAHRIRLPREPGVVYRDGCVAVRDLVLIGGVLVTCRARTIADLARQRVIDPDPPPQVDAALRRLCHDPGAVREAIVRLAQRTSIPGRPGALSLLRELERAATTT